ncbi:PIN domain-like protein [Lepidopterella palustris CBS 459.81]|uniref:PIN domain-like protein n=1 Tax=Lepidopterella palustris CBS 459.81 TaxID=1314670 RepID=A0A8E2DWV8_9PEZI|nr:PIN domain-like protein [Lepidopterella palustris CBS 459.81]
MGVTGLWTVLQPCARPIKIETLNKKRLAVDASIWIYQFLKAVRDKEGNALRNSHIVGFFRRICKLLFFGIKPVFVFDGGAPALKRQTISSRKQRREGRREDAVRTAGKLLALQMQRLAEEEERKRKDARRHPAQEDEEEPIPEDLVYAEEALQTPQERQRNRKFKKSDAYHLPDLDASLAEMGGPNDPRIMSLEELEQYARQFDTGEDINVYDFSKIDFDSTFFVSLPASDRYNILNAARLRSRLRMGYSKDQLDTMFPDRMAFSKFQIERVRERNELTQRLMNINGMADDAMFGANGASRVSGEKGREYVLVKNDGVEGGWALGVVTSKDEGVRNKPIDVDRIPEAVNGDDEDDDWEDDDEFEDVPIEGLNRLPKPKAASTVQDERDPSYIASELARKRHALYESRKQDTTKPKARGQPPVSEDPDSLFLAEEENAEDNNWEDVDIRNVDGLFEDGNATNALDEEEEGAELQRAIVMSLQQDRHESEPVSEEEDQDDYREVFQQQRVEESKPFAKASGLDIARMANSRSIRAAPKGPFVASESDEDDIDFQAALTESRKSKRATTTVQQTPREKKAARIQSSPPQKRGAPQGPRAPGFDGPLPFEKLDLGSSLLGKKKMKKLVEDQAGGFEKDGEQSKKSAEPLPPWFSGDLQADLSAQQEHEKEERQRDRKALEEGFQFQEPPRLRKQDTHEVIDLDAPQTQTNDVVTIESSEDERDGDVEMEDVVIEDPVLRTGDLAENVKAEPPQPLPEAKQAPLPPPLSLKNQAGEESQDEPIDWTDSDEETQASHNRAEKQPAGKTKPQPSGSPSPEFEDVAMTNVTLTSPPKALSPAPLGEDKDNPVPVLASGLANDNAPFELPPDDDSDVYSDPEDAELFASLAAEAEEHARFASSLNTTAAPIDFDKELKQLRSQQKKDRRDADEVTQTMVSECQHLLTLFGLPYITAPMEAEAQCAELVSMGLVDGIVTDDSDTFLFGGTRVYKNMFNAAKFVECYLFSDFVSEFSLTREKLIAIAQLLGSDYTPGIPGIGPVTALEILSEFDTLEAFKEWWTGVQNGTIPKEADKGSQWRRRFRRSQQAKLFLPTNFPDPRVADAYLHPDADDDPQAFQWGVPDLGALRSFLSSQIGWSAERTDEVLVPVIRDMNRREKEGTQSNITRFFDGAVGAGAFAPRVRDGNEAGLTGKKGKGAAGKRLGTALGRLAERGRDGGARANANAGETSVPRKVVENSTEQCTVDGRRKRKKAKGAPRSTPSPASSNDDDDDEDGLYAEPPRKTRKSARGGMT